jgi:hypothetical protein
VTLDVLHEPRAGPFGSWERLVVVGFTKKVGMQIVAGAHHVVANGYPNVVANGYPTTLEGPQLRRPEVSEQQDCYSREEPDRSLEFRPVTFFERPVVAPAGAPAEVPYAVVQAWMLVTTPFRLALRSIDCSKLPVTR